MNSAIHTAPPRQAPPDQAQRERALDPRRSILVQAPAGSGKTDLLTRRFLRLLCEVDDPGEIVAITFTRAAAAEMRHRILSELENASRASEPAAEGDPFAMASPAARALQRSHTLGWNLLNLPAQLRISTIDSFCREIALQEPLVSRLGGGLDVAENPSELYHQAARRTLQQIAEAGSDAPVIVPEIERLLLWRDNGWQEMESLLVEMLRQRDRWMQGFVLSREPDWEALRERLERPFARAVAEALSRLDQFLDQETRDEAMDLARFACGMKNNWLQCRLFHFAGLPCEPFIRPDDLEQARQGYVCLADMLLTKSGNLRRQVNVKDGFPIDRPEEKARVNGLLDDLRSIPGFEPALQAVRCLPPARYSEEEWQIVRSCFNLLRHAAAQLQVAFAEAGVVDFTEIAQIAQRVLRGPDESPSDAALALADGIRHLLVDEFQDTSRRQHRLIASLVAAWSDPHRRSLFVVGDPMQSIYFFRDADAELFPRVRTLGLELPTGETHPLDFAPLTSNFRTDPRLVETLNTAFAQIFSGDDGSGVTFSQAEPARFSGPAVSEAVRDARFRLHTAFVPQNLRIQASDPSALQRKQAVAEERETAREQQVDEIVALIRTHLENARSAALRGEKYRIAVLGRTRSALDPIARALREARIAFHAVDLEGLSDRPEVLDALALARALLNPEDRVAWLGVLRAPWCGLSLSDLYILTSNDDPEILRRPIPTLLTERFGLLSEPGRQAVQRLLTTQAAVTNLRAAHPSLSVGTLLEQAWLQLGGADCVDAAARANLDLLWVSLDKLQAGEPDLLGPGLEAALASLTAQPDPAADTEHGVHLMTIHKSKGLEFEVVIVPELQANCGTSRGGLLSWLERGLATPDDSGDITEFLVAPISAKGEESSRTRIWVNSARRDREAQETRRILYVAATRAREELHLFTRIDVKTDRNGDRSICDPRGTLLATAWPALEHQVREEFQAWLNQPEPAEITTIAAGGESNLLVMPSPGKPAILHRLPLDYRAPRPALPLTSEDSQISGPGTPHLYERHEGGERSRALGIAVHVFLEHLAGLRVAHEWPVARTLLADLLPRAVAPLRAGGLSRNLASTVAGEALDIALAASRYPEAQWILDPHPEAASEVRWAGILDGRIREVRVDRIFRAGSAPLSTGDSHWWIVDYKTAQADPADRSSLETLRAAFAPQLARYAEVLRNLHGHGASIRAALYYPRLSALDWWEI